MTDPDPARQLFALTPDAQFPYVLKDHRSLPVDQQAVFMLRVVPAHVRLACENLNQATMSMQFRMNVGDAKQVQLRAGIAGWSNWKTQKGHVIPFECASGTTSVCGVAVDLAVTLRALGSLPDQALEELDKAIGDLALLEPDTLKN